MLPHRYSSAMVPQRCYNDKMMIYRQKQLGHFNNSDNNNNNVYSVNAIEAQLRAAAVLAASQLSLYPHGDSYPDIGVSDLEIQRRLWPRPVWTHKENAMWQPSIVKTKFDFKRLGTEIIQRRCEDKLIPCFNGLKNFYMNIQPEPWQLVSPLNRHSNVIATRSLATDCDMSIGSDWSSVSSEEEADNENTSKLPALSFEFASNWDIDL